MIKIAPQLFQCVLIQYQKASGVVRRQKSRVGQMPQCAQKMAIAYAHVFGHLREFFLPDAFALGDRNITAEAHIQAVQNVAGAVLSGASQFF